MICFLEEQDRMRSGTFLVEMSLGIVPFSSGVLTLPSFKMTLFLTEMLLDVVSWFQPDSKIAEMKSHTDSPKGSSYDMLLPLQPLRLLCLRLEGAYCYVVSEFSVEDNIWYTL